MSTGRAVTISSTRSAHTPAQVKPALRPARSDIQALRALAVGLVLVYHLFPNVVTGGFVGVDVFFVISGFLISAHLIGSPPRSISDVLSFWARRVRRLLPAALLVLGVTLGVTRLVAPVTAWADTARQTIAAAMYVENWALASSSVDYLASDNAPTPIQHFWSLSVEEQFYFVWPLLIAALAVAAVRLNRRWLLGAGLGVLAVLSFAYSVHATSVSPASAYFVTPARAWEFAIGGLLAVAAGSTARVGGPWRRRLPRPGRVLLAATGVTAILVAALTYDGHTPFPGAHALTPTLGAAGVIVAALTVRDGALGRLMASRGAQVLGDHSYAVYLWHWPLIVLVPFVSSDEFGVLNAVAILMATALLSVLTKKLVEDPCRGINWLRPLRRTYATAGLCVVLVVGMASLQLVELDHRATTAKRQLDRAIASGDECFGSGVLRNPQACTGRVPSEVVPAPATAEDDKSDAYPDVSGGADCWSAAPRYPVVRCQFGASKAVKRVALVGNSHAGQWLPALQQIADRQGWQIDTFLASRCAMAGVAQNIGTTGSSDACSRWVSDVTQIVANGHYDLVVLSNRISVSALGSTDRDTSVQAYRRGYSTVLDTWSHSGVRVLAVRDTPAPGDGGIDSMPACVAAHSTDLAACSGPRAEWVPADPVVEAAQGVPAARLTIVDLNDQICGPKVCAGVVGGVLVYYDGSHLTATYARTLAPAILSAAEKVMSAS